MRTEVALPSRSSTDGGRGRVRTSSDLLVDTHPSASSSSSSSSLAVTMMHSVFSVMSSDPHAGVLGIRDEALAILANLMHLRNDDNAATEEMNHAMMDMRIILEFVYYLEQTVCTALVGAHRLRDMMMSSVPHRNANSMVRATPVSESILTACVARFSPMDLGGEVELSRRQQLILFLLNVIQTRGLRRQGTECYARTTNEFGDDTMAWHHECSIMQFIYDATRKEMNFDQWVNLTSNGTNVASLVEHMTHCVDSQFPVLVKDRHIFSFRNGVYYALTDTFLPYRRLTESSTQRPPAGASNCAKDHVAACKYFDIDFPLSRMSDECEDWYDLPTPHLQSIMDFQEFPEEVCRWLYILIGRLIYSVNEIDRWQVLPYLMGQASSGKSTIVMYVCRALYDIVDVGVLSNNLEKKFGIWALSDKLVFVAPEIKKDFQLEQAEFQSIVSGEAIQVNVKFERARSITWEVPGIMAGNQFPDWTNNSGSISRRVIIFNFENKVVRGDTELGKKLDLEMAHIILKCNRGYLQAVNNIGTDNVWTHLPNYFRDSGKELSPIVIGFETFYNDSSAVDVGDECYISWPDLKSKYRDYATAKVGRASVSTLHLEEVRRTGNLRLDKTEKIRKYPRGTNRDVTADAWVIGMDVKTTAGGRT